MTNEKVIEYIQSYLLSLSDEDQKVYRYMIKSSAENNKPIRELMKRHENPISYLAEIVQELKQDIKDAEARKSGKKSELERTKLLRRILQKNTKNNFRFAWREQINGREAQCILEDNGTLAFALWHELDMPTTDQESQLSLSKVMPSKDKLRKAEFDIAEIKMQKKIKAQYVKVGEKYYNPELFVKAYDGLGGDVELYQNENPLSMDLLENENGIAIIFPMRLDCVRAQKE